MEDAVQVLLVFFDSGGLLTAKMGGLGSLWEQWEGGRRREESGLSPREMGARVSWEGLPKPPQGAGGTPVANGLLDGGALLAPRWRQPEVSELVSRTHD